MEWKLADAKNKLSEVVSRALSEGPQFINRRKDGVVLLSREEYETLIGKKLSFKDLLLNSGPDLDDLDLSRDQSGMRDVSL